VSNYRASTNTNNTRNNIGKNKQKQGKSYHFLLFVFKPEFINITVYLQIDFAAETHQDVGQWPEGQQNIRTRICSEHEHNF
jgi:hypothetical protein